MSLLRLSADRLRQFWQTMILQITKPVGQDSVWFSVWLSIITAGGLFVWQAPKSLNIQDEGYLWYGTRQVMNGFVPIRDFLAYDPLRYYFGALVQYAVNDTGIWSIRLATTLISMACLFVVLLVVSHNVAHTLTRLSLIVVALTSGLWLYPSHKVYDIFASLLLVYMLGKWIQTPSLRIAYYVGVVEGIVVLINRNHGLYAGISTLCVVLWLSRSQQFHWRTLRKQIGLLVCGGLTGLLPFIGMLLFIPGFAEAYYYNQVLYFYNLNATNLTLPIPWPWQVTIQERPFTTIWYDIVAGAYFVYVVLAGAVGWALLGWWWYKKQTEYVNAYLVASIILIPVYAHHVFSRADIAHLSQGFMPVLIATIVAIRMRASVVRQALLLGFLGLSTYLMLPQHPGYQCSVSTCPIISVNNQAYQGNKRITTTVQNIVQVIQKHNAADSFVIAPYAPGMYALMNSTSPFYFSYNVYAQSVAIEQDQINQLVKQKIRLVLIDKSRVDGRKDLGFAKTSPLTYAYIKAHYTFAGVSEKYEVYLRNP